MAGALDGLKIVDLTRILAGPTCTQLLGDLGAEVVKIENPSTQGDDTRSWGPPFARDADGGNTDLSAYFMCANRNKLSVALDIATPEGQAAVRAMVAEADVLVENFKPGGLTKYGLDADTMLKLNPRLVYCSISGYGHTGPNASKPGYDLMAQGYGGIMSLTGAADGEPMKVGVGIADVMCGMYACVGILAALRHRDATGEGQHIDIALVDSQIAWMINEGVNYLTSGDLPKRRGNAHPNIVPYQVFATSDGHVIVAVGNDTQFIRFCDFLNLPDLATDLRFATNPARLANRDALIPLLEPALAARSMAEVIEGLEARRVPVGPVQTMDQVFASDQVAARGMVAEVPTPGVEGESVRLIGNPLKLSLTPVTYRRPPPRFGADTDAVLGQLLSES
ncbi:CaiB/BaiF CoA transferase family protein [Oceaniglobus indicus]|uniref:CaiB/BaiF CoA transferase family protein n=1 Tax=Oceaniglobus indicus TaxID=2047749 RepID=UPI000C19E360|nr:CoA transferase [Oceaniglobus indicus]